MPPSAGKRELIVVGIDEKAVFEGAVFSDDGQYLYVGNFNDRDISILKVDGDMLVNTGKTFQLPGQPASMGGGARAEVCR